MKKLLAFLLVLVMVMSVCLIACDNKAKTNNDNEDDDWGNGNGTTNNDTNTNDDNNTDDDVTPAPVELKWTDKDDEIYVAQNTYLRNSPSLSDKSTKVVVLGDELKRVATAQNGPWDKIEYNGDIYYIMKYVTVTNKNTVTFEDVTEDIQTTVINEFTTGESQYVLRTSPCYKKDYKTELDKINWATSVKKSDGNLKVLALSLDETWARVEYKGTEYYVQTYCLEAYADNSGDDTPTNPLPSGPIA